MPILDPYEIIDPRFAALTLIHVELERLHSTSRWAEGPVWFADSGSLVWSDIPNDRMLRWLPDGTVSTFRTSSNNSNGNSRDRQGRLITCEHRSRRVTRTEWNGTLTVIADRFEGRRLNSPNDVVVRTDGTIWFTDPTYGIMGDYEGDKAAPEQPVRGVYRVDPAIGEITRVIDDFTQPNGLAFSPDEQTLYVADSGGSHDPAGPHHIRRFTVTDDGTLKDEGIFAVIDQGVPDGMRVDVLGNLWSSAADGVHCFAPDGTLLGKIKVPEVVANLCFGGPKRNRLFIAATSSVYAIYVGTRGCPVV